MYQPYGYPYYSYDNSFYQQYQQELLQKNEDKRAIRRLANCVGGAVIVYLILQSALSSLIPALGLTELYTDNAFFQTGLNTILVVVTILPSFVFFGKKMKKISGIENPVPLNRPRGFVNTALAFFAGMGICMVANYTTGIVTVITSVFGYTPTTPDLAMPEGVFGFCLSFVQIVLTAATVEELSLRGYTMGNLRKYGDKFAIIASSIVFALIHGNFIQIPFALIVGLGIGYLTVKTRSLWTGVLIHAGNNLFSVVSMYGQMYFEEELFNAVYTSAFMLIAAVGLGCLAVFVRRNREYPLVKSLSPLSTKEKVSAFITSPAIIIVAVVMLLTSLVYLIPVGE